MLPAPRIETNHDLFCTCGQLWLNLQKLVVNLFFLCLLTQLEWQPRPCPQNKTGCPQGGQLCLTGTKAASCCWAGSGSSPAICFKAHQNHTGLCETCICTSVQWLEQLMCQRSFILNWSTVNMFSGKYWKRSILALSTSKKARGRNGAFCIFRH